MSFETKDAGSAVRKAKEGEEANYEVMVNPEFQGFQRIEVTKIDESKPWKPALEVKVTKADGSIVENLDASITYAIFRSKGGIEMSVTLEKAGHIDKLHIKGEDAGSHFNFSSFDELLKEIAKKMPETVATEKKLTALSIEMGVSMGKEGLATLEELESAGVVTEEQVAEAMKMKDEVGKLNKDGSADEKNAFIAKFLAENGDSPIQFQLVRGVVLVPIVKTEKHDTSSLFLVFGPGKDKKTMYTAAPGRFMPKMPVPGDHIEGGVLNEEAFKESADAWFRTAMLTG